MLSVKSDGPKDEPASGRAKNGRRGTIVNRRAGLKTALSLAMRTPKPQSLPSYLVKVLLSLVQARLEAKVYVRMIDAISVDRTPPSFSRVNLAKGICLWCTHTNTE